MLPPLPHRIKLIFRRTLYRWNSKKKIWFVPMRNKTQGKKNNTKPRAILCTKYIYI